MILKRSSALLAHFMVLSWVLVDLVDKSVVLFGDQALARSSQPFGCYYGLMLLGFLTPVPRRPKLTLPLRGKRVAAALLAVSICVILVVALFRFGSSSPTRTLFALDVFFVPVLLTKMWSIPRHDLEVVKAHDRPKHGTLTSPVPS